MTTLTRSYRFSASHRLHSPEMTPAENSSLYGKCNHPFGHGHDYRLEVTVAGPIDEHTGLMVRAVELDRLVEDKVLQLFANRYINVDVPQFGNLVATTENVASVIGDLVRQHWTSYISSKEARLFRVQIQETDRNGFEILFGSLAGDAEYQSQGAERIMDDVLVIDLKSIPCSTNRAGSVSDPNTHYADLLSKWSQ